LANNSENNKKDKEKLYIVRKLFHLIDNLTDEFDDDFTGTTNIRVIRRILKCLMNEEGLIATLIFNLSNPKDDD